MLEHSPATMLSSYEYTVDEFHIQKTVVEVVFTSASAARPSSTDSLVYESESS